jgi:hypothetical protein
MYLSEEDAFIALDGDGNDTLIVSCSFQTVLKAAFDMPTCMYIP